MARMPGADWKPLADNWASQPRMSAFDIVCIHTMVGGLLGTDSLFRTANGVGYAGTESHFGTGHDGRIIQWQDTAFRAEANYNGNHHIISIENADYGIGFPAWNLKDGSAVPAFTEAQIEANAQIIAWACRTHNIPCELIPDAKPGRRGIAYHRQGVPGYMVAGAEQWSTSRGKVCPGDRRIAQIPRIIARAREILNGDDMSATAEAQIADLHRAAGAGGAAAMPLPVQKSMLAVLWDIQTKVSTLAGVDVDENAIVEGLKPLILSSVVPAVVAALREEVGDGVQLDEQRLGAITEGALRRVLGGLDTEGANA